MTLALACTCGWPIPGATVEEQLSALAAHIAAVHPGVTVEEIRVDQQRAGWRVAPQLPTWPRADRSYRLDQCKPARRVP